ncbi:MAG: dihydropteroate synthase [Thermotogota bacterium]|nr:dihydropteroate synthase [Thermotogota bacterium]
MEMCILGSDNYSEPGCFVFDNSYLTLKITGKKDELNEMRSILRNRFRMRFMNDRLLVFGSTSVFLSFINYHQRFSKTAIIKDLENLLQSKKVYLNLPHGGKISLSKPLIMGVINVTDDSFYARSRVLDEKTLEKRVHSMIEDGADIIDIGAESTRPGSTPVDEQLEIERVIPFIKKIRTFSNIPISVDTYRKRTAQLAIDSGADLINDISALRFDKEMGDFAAINSIPVVLMHMKGTPSTMQKKPYYSDVLLEVNDFFTERIVFAESKGINRRNLILDPGIGFGKRLKDNLAILNNLDLFHSFRLPLMLGTSRKSFIGEVLNQKDPMERLAGTMGTTALGVQKGIHIFRVHDVKENRNIADLVFNIKKS